MKDEGAFDWARSFRRSNHSAFLDSHLCMKSRRLREHQHHYEAEFIAEEDSLCFYSNS
jgi:hypothetical protein